MSHEMRHLTDSELDAVSGANPLVVGIIVGFLAQGMADKVSEEVGLFDAIDFNKMKDYAKGKQKPA